MLITRLDIAVLAAYLATTLGVGVYQALKIKSSGDYYAGGRKFNKFYLMMHALGTASHADEPVSVVGGAFEKGFSGIWYTYMYLPLTPIFWLLAPYIRRTRFMTTADFFQARYDRSLAILYAVMGVLKMSIAIGVVLKGTATIFNSVTGGTINEQWAIFAMTVVFVTYGFAGGLRATMVTESIQGPLIVVMSLLMVPFGLHAVGGFHGLHENLRASMFSLTSAGNEFSAKWIVATVITALTAYVAEPGLVAAVGSGKTELEGRVGYTYGTMIKRICALGWVMTGVILASMVAGGILPADRAGVLHAKREFAFGAAMQALLPHGLVGLMFAAIFASQMSTLSAQMVNSSALASRNLYLGVFRPSASDREVLVFGRICGLFLVSIGVTVAMSMSSVANALTTMLQFASIMGVTVWGGVLWRRATAKGAWAAVIVLFGCWLIFGPAGMGVRASHLGWPAWVGMYGDKQYVFELMLCYLLPGYVTLIVVSLFTKPQPREQLDHFFMLLNTPVGQEEKLIAAGVPMVYVGNCQANELEKKYPRLVHWGGFLLAAFICVLILGLLKFLANVGA
jgi:Na+/proline symporter